MGYKGGGWGRGTVNATGSHGNRKNRFNAKVTMQGFKQLASVVQSAADSTAHQVLSNHGMYKMSFDETDAVPTTVPGSGTVLLSGLGDNPVEQEQVLMQMANASLEAMQEAFVQQIKEAGL